jgi:hypothetical protein
VTKTKQPELADGFGVPFRGRVHTATGDIWWYEKYGRRYALKPAIVTERPEPETQTKGPW